MSYFKNFTYIKSYNINMRLHTRFLLHLSSKDSLPPTEVLPTQVRKAMKFLRKGNMHQRLRKEIQFGLMPTTLKGTSENHLCFSRFLCLFLSLLFHSRRRSTAKCIDVNENLEIRWLLPRQKWSEQFALYSWAEANFELEGWLYIWTCRRSNWVLLFEK